MCFSQRTNSPFPKPFGFLVPWIIGEEAGGAGEEIYDSDLGGICMAPGILRVDGVDGF